MKVELKIGETGKVHGINVQCLAMDIDSLTPDSDACRVYECCFLGRNGLECISMMCHRRDREDKTDVYFKKVE